MCLTKPKVVLLILLFIMISTSAYAEITQEEARNIVLNSLGTRIDSVDVYQKFDIVGDSIQLILPDSLIASPFNYSWAFFIDDYPFSGWMHPCSYYFVNNDNGNYEIVHNDLCPSQNENFQLFYTIRDTSYSDETEEGIPRNVTTDPTKYAIIINGGINSASNYLISWHDMSAVYSTLTKYYGYLRENIFVFSTDGSYLYNFRKLDLDGDEINDINGYE